MKKVKKSTLSSKKSPARKAKKKAVASRSAKKTVASRGAKKAVVSRGLKKAVASRGTKKAVVSRGAKKAVASRGVKKAVVSRGAKKAVASRSFKKVVAKKASSYGGGYGYYSSAKKKNRLSSFTNVVDKIVNTFDSNYYEKELIYFLNESDVSDVQNFLGLILKDKINLKSIKKLDRNEIKKKSDRAYSKLTIEEKLTLKSDLKKLLENQNLLNFDWCKYFDLCNTINVTKQYKRMKIKFLNKLKKVIKPLDGIIKPMLAKILYDEGTILLELFKADPHIFIIVLIFVLVTTKGIMEYCECDNLNPA